MDEPVSTINVEGIQARIAAMLPQMTEAVADEMRKKALSNIEHWMASAISQEVQRYVKEVVTPQVRADLEAHAAEFRAAILAAVKGTLELVTGRILAVATERLAGWQGGSLIDEYMRSVFGRVGG